MRKIYEIESEFYDAFWDAVNEINERSINGNPMKLKEVLEFGFNSVSLNGQWGYEQDDFPTEELEKRVEYNDWDYDGDMYRVVYLKEIKEV